MGEGPSRTGRKVTRRWGWVRSASGGWRLSDQGQVRGGPARGRSRYPRPAVGAPSRRGSAIKPGSGGPRPARRPPQRAVPGSAASPLLRRMRLLPALLVLAAAWPWARAGERGLRPRDPSVALPWPLGARAPRTPPRLRPGRWGGAGGGSGEARAAGRGGRGAAGAERVRDCGVRGPRPSAGRRAGPGQECVSEPPRRTPPFLTLSGVPPSAWVAVRPAGAQCLVAAPGPGQGQQIGCGGARSSPLPTLGTLSPDAASILHLQNCVGSLEGDIRRPEPSRSFRPG